MSKMARTIRLLVITVLLVAAFPVGAASVSADDASQAFSIGLVLPNLNSPFFEGMVAGAQEAADNNAVDLVVSLGSALITVPNVVGNTYTTAVSTISGAGLTIGNVSTVLTRRSCGIVRSQSPTGGTSVAPGSAVNLVVTRTRTCNPL